MFNLSLKTSSAIFQIFFEPPTEWNQITILQEHFKCAQRKICYKNVFNKKIFLGGIAITNSKV